MSKKINLRVLVSAILISLIFLPPVLVGAFELAWKDRIYPGVFVADVNLEGLTEAQAKEKIKALGEKQNTIKLSFEDQSWQLNLDDIGTEYQSDITAQKVISFGRKSSLVGEIYQKINALREGKVYDLDFSWNQENLDQFISTISGQINQKEIPTSLTFSQGKLAINQGRLGRTVAKQGLINLIQQTLSAADFDKEIKVPVVQTGSLPTDGEIEKTINRAINLTEKSIILADSSINFVIQPEQIISFLDFENGWQRLEIEKYVDGIKESVDSPAQNAHFQFENDRVTVFSPAKTGTTLDREKTINLIAAGLISLEVGRKDNEVIELPIIKTEPEINTQDSNELGISGLVGKGESWFHHSIPSRVANVKLASSKFNGVLIKPGETFSFNKTLGEVSRQTGYQSAWIIKDGRTVLGDGGGVCQVSTTLFRAALNSGLSIVERHAHSYRVSYYEENYQLGVDATVFSPSVDLKIENDYNCWLLVQTKIDPENYYLSFEIYGCPDGRKIEIGDSKVWAVTAPPPDKYVDDPTLPAGTIKQVDFRSGGAKASFDWKVTKDGKTLHQKSFYSNYRSWQAVFLRGTGN